MREKFTEKTIEFMRMKFGSEVRMGAFTTSTLAVMALDECMFQLSCEVLSKDVGIKTFKYKYETPATWWDMFKEQHPKLCKWFSSPSHITNTGSIVVDFYICFPECDMLFPDSLGEPYIRMLRHA